MPYDYFCISQWAPVRQKRHYISSPMKPFRIISLIAVAAMLLAGCRSHKANVSSPHGQWGNGYHDYSSEVTDAMGADLAEEARGWLGTPYRYGGADRRGTDCSGLVMELYRSVCATKLPRTTVEQKSYCTKVARNKARVGDLMFFGSSKGGGQISHVGLYIGKGEMIHASSSRGVMVSNVDAGYWGDRFRGTGRVDGAYNAWARTDRGSRALKGKKKDRNPVTPDEIPTPDRPVAPLPIGEIAYDKLPAGDAPENMEPASSAPAMDNSMTTQPEKTSQQPSATPQGTQANAVKSADATETIDLLDLIINQKVDSIFSTRFMD